jgi:hypothetical protein
LIRFNKYPNLSTQVKKLLLLSAALFPISAITANAQAPGFQTEALLIFDGAETQTVWLTAATETRIRYRETAVGVDLKDMNIADVKSIYIMEPRDFTAAVDLFQGRKYEEAKQKFAALKTAHKPLAALPGNHSVLSAFYEMECMRKLGDLEGLNTALQDFIKGRLQRPHQEQQVELYTLWDAVRTQGWARLDTLAKEKETVALPGDQRAQVAYCHGLALEGLEKPILALNAYNVALTADTGASEGIARDAALNILRILAADAEVQLAMKLWGTPDERPNTPGHFRLLEAAAVASLFEQTLGSGAPLPAEYKAFLKYHKKEDA